MRKKLLLTLLLCMVMSLLFAFSVSAEECTEHTNEWTVTLGSEGFLGKISAKGECSTCGSVTTETIPALFITRGYSYSENGGIAQGYGINRAAIQRYEQLTKEKVSFGGVLTLRDVIGNADPLNDKAEPIHEKVQKKDLTDTEYSIINVMIQGIPSAAYDSAKVICTLYVNAGGKTTYIDNKAEKVHCGEKTFNQVVAKPEADTPSVNEYTIIKGDRYFKLTNEELQLKQGYFWNNSNKAPQQNGTNTTFNNKYWTPSIYFTEESLPNGSIVMVDSANGWQYRPHKWSGTRPDNTKEARVVVDDAWWGSYTYVGFNISKYTKGTGYSNTTDQFDDISMFTAEQILEHFQIYVPVTSTLVPNAPLPPTQESDEPSTPNTPVEPDEPLTDYSALKQDWADDGVLRILTIGNSFSDDSMQYVYQVAQSAGIENVVLGNLYIGGCSLETHLSNAKDDKSAYTYRTNTNGTWNSKNGVSIKTAVESDDWDFISMQQVSGYSGVSSSYSILNDLIRIVEPLNPSARLVWHMTWAYQTGSGHADFAKYDRNQMTMYNAIIDAVKTNVVTNDHIDYIIPAGTAIQNVRTSYIGDTLTRDGYHLSYDYGRLIGSLSFVKALTGVSIDNVTYTPDGVDANKLAVAIEAVNNAYANPFEVVKSSYTTTPEDSGNQGGNEGGNEGGSEVTAPAVPEGYNWLTSEQMGLVEGAYYQSDANSNWYALNYATNDFGNGFITTKKFTKDELPVGTIIVIADGWQYRPEGWVNGAKNSGSSRPVNVTTNRVVIDEEWWGSWTERAFNVSKTSNTVNTPVPLTEQEKADFTNAVFFIYVPQNPVTPDEPDEPDEPVDNTVYVLSSDCDEEVVTINGKQYRALSYEAMGYIKRAYYYSTAAVSDKTAIYSQTDSTSAKFWATKHFDKTNLPIGAVIWVNSGWQYRPEGWINGNGGSRPGNVTTTYVTADEAWWSSWTLRGFNISRTNGASIGTDASVTAETIHENFKIYIPVENIKEVIE